MSPGQGPGISKAWDKTVIVGDFETSGWGDLDLLGVYTKSFGVDVVPGQKYFLEPCWIDELSGYVSEKTYVCFHATEGESAHARHSLHVLRLSPTNVHASGQKLRSFLRETIRLIGYYPIKKYPDTLRLVVYEDFEAGKVYHFLTNDFSIEDPLTIAELYRERW